MARSAIAISLPPARRHSSLVEVTHQDLIHDLSLHRYAPVYCATGANSPKALQLDTRGSTSLFGPNACANWLLGPKYVSTSPLPATGCNSGLSCLLATPLPE